MLPADYNIFAEEFRRNPSSTWIIKPAGKGVQCTSLLCIYGSHAQLSKSNSFNSCIIICISIYMYVIQLLLNQILRQKLQFMIMYMYDILLLYLGIYMYMYMYTCTVYMFTCIHVHVPACSSRCWNFSDKQAFSVKEVVQREQQTNFVRQHHRCRCLAS